MAENADARARGAIERIFAQAKKRETIKGFVGKPNGNGTYTIYTGYAPGWVYVRLTDAVDGSIAIAIAMNTNLDPAVEVEMERVDGMLVIKTAVPAQAARLYGNSTPQAQNPPQQQPPAGYTNKNGGEISLVTKDGNALGGLVVRITAYRHRGGWWSGTDTITLTPTSTSGQRAWVLVGVNTKTNAITQALSTNRSVGYTPFPESDVNAVINAYPDVDWRAAVNLANGETSIDVSDILDLTNRGETRPKSNYTATSAPGVGDDSDDGYSVGSIWIDVTGDNVYQCTDATAGAAVWAHLNASATFSGDAFDVPYTPTTSGDWSSVPSDVGAALDTLAGDVDTLAGATYVQSVGAGTNISVDNTDPANPILSSTSSPGGGAPPSICEGRLTLTSGTPITTTDVTAAGTVYWAPHRGNYIGLYSGSAWELLTFSELSISLSGLLPHSLHDMFIYNNSGTPTLELTAWTAGDTGAITGATNATPIVITTSGTAPATGTIVTISGVGGNTAANGTFRVTNLSGTTFSLQTLAANANVAGSGAYTSGGNWYRANYTGTRATAITTQDGISVKSGATTRRLLGTIRITATAGQTEDSEARRLVSNLYNPVIRTLRVNEGTDSWSYGTAAWRPLNNSLLNRVEIVVCEDRHITIDAIHNANRVSGNHAGTGIDVDGISTDDSVINGWLATGNASLHAKYRGYQAAGFHYFQQLEVTNGASQTFYGDFGQTYPKTGMSGEMRN